MSRQSPILVACACGCGREFYIHKSQAWKFWDSRVFYRNDCPNKPRTRGIKRSNYTMYAQEGVG